MFSFLGLQDIPGEGTVKIYCPKCNDVYAPRSGRFRSDGAYFGTGFPHMFFMVHPEYRPLKPSRKFVPRLYGFQIHPLALTLQEKEGEQMNAEKNAMIYLNKPTKQQF